MVALYPTETQFAIFPTEESYHSIVGTYTHGADTHHFHLVTFRDLDSLILFGQMIMDYTLKHQTVIPSVFLKAINNEVK